MNLFHFLLKWIHTVIGVRVISWRNILKIMVHKAYWLFVLLILCAKNSGWNLFASSRAVWEVHFLRSLLQYDSLLYCQAWLSQLPGLRFEPVFYWSVNPYPGVCRLACWCLPRKKQTGPYLLISAFSRWVSTSDWIVLQLILVDFYSNVWFMLFPPCF